MIENCLDGDELRTDVAEIDRQITALKPESIAAVMTTTSCFAPRGIDKLEDVGLMNYTDIFLVNDSFIFVDSSNGRNRKRNEL